MSNKIVRLFPEVYDIQPFLCKEHPILHPEVKEYKDYWEEQERLCIEGLWGLDKNVERNLGGWRYMPPQLYWYATFCPIEQEDEESNSTRVDLPLTRDVEWVFFYNWFICRGFSGFDSDTEYTCNDVVRKLESGALLSLKDRNKLDKSKNIRKPNGEYKKYIAPRDYLYKTHDNSLGLPLYENEASNLLLLTSRRQGKSMWLVAVLSHIFKFHGSTRFDDDYLQNKRRAAAVIGSVLGKSADTLKHFAFLEEYHKNNFGSYGEDDTFVPGYFYQQTSGTLATSNQKSPYRHEYLEKVNNVDVKKGTGTRIVHVTYENNPEASVGQGPLVSIIEEVALCFGENTEIRMGDGSIKFIQDIKAGDFVMNNIGEPEEVVEIGNGVEELYEVKQQASDSYVVSKDHILYLEQKANISTIKDDGIKKILVQDFNESILGKYRYRTTYGIKNNLLEFNKKSLLLEPYYLGLYIGDGCIKKGCIVADIKKSNEIVTYLSEYAKRIGNEYGLKTYGICHYINKKTGSKSINFIRQSLKTLDIFDKKIIPTEYLLSTVNDRLELLAGLIDTDGNITNKGKTSQAYEFSQTNRIELIEQIEFLARSLGFKVKRRVIITNKGYDNKILTQYRTKYRLRISGNIWIIPCKIDYKKAEIINHKKDFTRCRIEVNNIGIGKYFGIKLKNNPLFLLKDNTVVHNCDNFLKVLGANEPGLKRNTKLGSHLCIGTAGNILRIADTKVVFENPEDYHFLSFPDLWENRAKSTGLFIPGYYVDNALRDSNGNQNLEEAFNVEMEIRASKAKADNSYALDAYMMDRPLIPSELFLSGQSNIFPKAALQDQLTRVEIKKLYEVYSYKGSLDWNKTRTNVIFKPDIQNKLKPILSNNLDQYKGNLKGALVCYEAPEEETPNPTKNRSLYKVVYDPYRDDGEGSSLASIIVYKGISEDNWATGLQDDIVAEYLGRMDLVEDVHELCVKIALYYNAKVMVETNIPDFVRYCKREGWYNLLQSKPYDAISRSVKNPGKKYDVGIDMTSPELHEQAEQLIRQWLLTDWKVDENGNTLKNLNKLKSPAILIQLLQYERKKNFDHVSALKLLMLWKSQERMVPIKKASELARETVDDFYKQLSHKTRTNHINQNYHNY